MVLSLSPRSLAWGRLLRVSLFATAAADPVVGALLAKAALGLELGPRLLLAPLASLCVYHGAMALNDVADLEADRCAGRARPLVEGSISRLAAVVAVVMLLASGLGLAWLAGGLGGLAWLGAAAAIAVVYDLFGRGGVVGPLLLAAARAANVGFGAACVGWSLDSGSHLPLLAALLYGSYVLVVSRLGRMEDGEDERELGRRPSVLLLQLGVLLVLGPAVIGASAWLQAPGGWPTGAALGAGLLGLAFGLDQLRRSAPPLFRAAQRGDWTPAKVEGVMGLCLSRLLPFGVIAALLARASFTTLLACLVLFGLGLAGRRLMATFPPS
ncbi:MAG: UbiA family prenyltransferase [Planctomycetota bacterium]|nr:UbiA family prenyltransferase [Planctomycetota bacterium]